MSKKKSLVRPSDRALREIRHGQLLANIGAESSWGWGTSAGRERANRRAALIIRAGQLNEKSRILEIGCGTGLFTKKFAETDAHITAVDISIDLIKQAREQCKSEKRVEFICGQFEELSLPETFDTIVGSSVLHHLDVEKSVHAIFQMLKPGGRLAFAEPNMLNPQIFAERTFLRNYSKYTSPDETAFVRWAFQRLLEAEGFVKVQIRPFDWLHPATPKRLIKPLTAAGTILERIPFMKEFSGSLIISGFRPV
jgi:2-polyprenyl-3-methyl-5-hydroxy-6-metoxy-1,4-benzoquinol methylase